MKEVKAGDYWRAIYKRSYNVAVRRVAFRNVVGWDEGEVRFAGGISAVCGGNGVGKSTILEAILKSLDVSQGRSIGSSSARFDCAVLDVEASREGGLVRRTTQSGDADQAASALVDVTFLDPALESMRIAKLLNSVANFDELLEAISPRDMDESELVDLSYLVGKRYSRCLVYEVEEFDDEDVFPYFRVVDSGGEYGSEGMGLGEMAIHITNWYLGRVPPNSVLLIEEPETHLAPRSQDALMNAVARASVTRGLWVILTTHAPSIVRRIPPKHIRLVLRSGAETIVLDSPSRVQLNTVLGVKTRFEGVILVEDKAAREFVRALLDRAAPDIGRTFQVLDVGSNAMVVAALNSFPRKATWISIIGLLDGDQRGTEIETTWPCGFLPGSSGPEALIREAASANRLGEFLFRDASELLVALSGLEGSDDHDWLEELPRMLGVSYEAAISALVGCWLETDGVGGAAQELCEFIYKRAEIE
jgi:predicted ATPase